MHEDFNTAGFEKFFLCLLLSKTEPRAI
ncbi:MAG: hypothetical protein PWQ54_2305, partial [Bacteroidales bacterium]|nr:hypothetical protein [Bacteroidales bacterium]